MGIEKSHGFLLLTGRDVGEDIDVSRAMDVNVSTLLCVSLDHRKSLDRGTGEHWRYHEGVFSVLAPCKPQHSSVVKGSVNKS